MPSISATSRARVGLFVPVGMPMVHAFDALDGMAQTRSAISDRTPARAMSGRAPASQVVQLPLRNRRQLGIDTFLLLLCLLMAVAAPTRTKALSPMRGCARMISTARGGIPTRRQCLSLGPRSESSTRHRSRYQPTASIDLSPPLRGQ